jgi:hypothetical protein
MTDQTPSFDEGHAAAGPATCSRCETALTEYWAVDGAVLCERCKDEVLEERSSAAGSTARVAKAFGIGSAGMLAGAAVWYAVAKFSGYEIGLIAILLGYLVGKGVLLGSGKRGGLGYQLLAVALTYLGIGVGMAPLAYQEVRTAYQQEADSLKAADSVTPVTQLSDSAIDVELATLDSAIASSKTADADALPAGAAVAVGLVAILVLILSLPILSIVGGGSIIGLFIYGLALFEAFRLTRKVEPEVSGPHAVGATPA